ncbi:MAG: GldG family protein [Dokdonella sp.]
MASWSMRSLAGLLVVVAAICIAFLSTRYRGESDWSAGGRASLSAATTQLLDGLTEPVDVISYARPDGGLRDVIRDFIERYQHRKPDITLRFVDPDSDPEAMRDAGIRIDGELQLSYRGRNERLLVLSENEFSKALLRLSRARERVVGFLDGDGERHPLGKANADIGQFVLALGGQGIRAVPLALAAIGKIPDNIDLMVVANPQIRLPDNVVGELVDYVDRGGQLLWMTEPGEDVGLGALSAVLSLRALPGRVVDGSGQAFGLGDPSFVAISQYPKQTINSDFGLTTLFPQAAALVRTPDPQWKLESILKSSAQSWNETGAMPKVGEAAADISQDINAGEVPGPLDLGFALSRSSPRPDRSEQRAVVIGDGDFLSNTYLGNAGNREFGLRVFNWLLQDGTLIDIPERSAPDRTLSLSQSALNLIGLFTLIALPLLLIASGIYIRWRRRRH